MAPMRRSFFVHVVANPEPFWGEAALGTFVGAFERPPKAVQVSAGTACVVKEN